MELKTLILGLFVSFAAFALKAGGGLSYLFATRPGAKGKAAVAAGFAAVYALAFSMAGLILSRVDLTGHMDLLQAFFKSGMFLHFLLAVLMALWGRHLVSAPGTGKDAATGQAKGRTRGWIPLVVPCPVCFTVILLSIGFLRILYPGHPGLLWTLYLFFVLVSFAVAFPLSFAMGRVAPEPLLGGLMLYLSAYFMLTVFMVPAFSDLDKIYRIASADSPFSPSVLSLILGSGAIAAVALGFLCPLRHNPKENNHP